MAPTDTYRTVSGRGRVRFTVNGSEFIGHVAPTETKAEAEKFVKTIDEEYVDATHNVPAYRVRADPFREYASDDGEPSGSAGKPILSVLQGQDLQNVCVVVTRYFGGTELGVGGLVRTYSKAATGAIENAGTETRRPRSQFRITVGYNDSGTVRGILESEGAAFDADYDEEVTFEGSIPLDEAETLFDRLRSATGGRVNIDDRKPNV